MTRGGDISSPRLTRVGWVLLVTVLMSTIATPVRAHPASVAAATARIDRSGEVELGLNIDVLAWALNDSPVRVPDRAMLALLEGSDAALEIRLDQARARMAHQLYLVADGQRLAVSKLDTPSVRDIRAVLAHASQIRLPVLLACHATFALPPQTQCVSFGFPEVVGPLMLTVECPNAEPYSEALSEGATTGEIPVQIAPQAAVHRSGLGLFLLQFGQFIRLGFNHIIPMGWDHVLFVLGLFLLGGRISTLLWQVSVFTLAHSVTLGLALYGVLQARASIVEPLIAASILLVAIDNLRGPRLHAWRLAVIFVFGAIHGLGFAGALQQLALPRGEYLWALAGFNVGIEVGQFAVVSAAMLSVGWWRRSEKYRRWVVIPGSVCIGCIAIFWTLTRTFLV